MSAAGASGAGLTISIDLAALAENWRRLEAIAAPAECAAVVKADAYGIGIDEAAPALWAARKAMPQRGWFSITIPNA